MHGSAELGDSLEALDASLDSDDGSDELLGSSELDGLDGDELDGLDGLDEDGLLEPSLALRRDLTRIIRRHHRV